MRRATKIWLIVAAALVVVGGMAFVGVMSALKWDFTKISTVKYEINNYEIHEAYQNITIVTDTADIQFVPTEGTVTSVECHEQKNLKHSVMVSDGTLIIELVDTRKWYECIGIGFGNSKMTVTIPQGEYGALSIKSSTGDMEIPKEFKFESMDITASTGDVTNYAPATESMKIKTSTGDIRVEDVSAGSLALSVSTGKVTITDVTCEGDVSIRVSTGDSKLTDVACKSVTSSGDTGKLTMTNVIAAEQFSIERDTGDVKLDGCDAAEIYVKTSTGDVTGTLLSEKIFVTQTSTGNVKVPACVTGGKCSITTSTGDIRITIIE